MTEPVDRDEALRLVLEGAAPLPAREQPLDEALGLVAAEAVTAIDPIPPNRSPSGSPGRRELLSSSEETSSS